MASEEQIERIARQLCIAAGKDPDRITALTFVPPHPREWMQFQEAAREALLVAETESHALWQPITSPPQNIGDRPYIVSDGTYLEKARWDKNVGWYRTAEGGMKALEPKPTHWTSEGELLRLIPVQKVPLP